jgi:S-adenosylmethionine hydrolase
MLDTNNENIDWTRDSEITVEEVKNTEGLTHLTDEQANEVVDFIKTYCNLMYNLHKQQVEEQQQKNENQNIISIDKYQQIKKAA